MVDDLAHFRAFEHSGAVLIELLKDSPQRLLVVHVITHRRRRRKVFANRRTRRRGG